jgi:hypothetical protein
VISKLGDKEEILYCDIDLNAPSRRDTEPHMRDLDTGTFEMMREFKLEENTQSVLQFNRK